MLPIWKSSVFIGKLFQEPAYKEGLRLTIGLHRTLETRGSFNDVARY